MTYTPPEAKAAIKKLIEERRVLLSSSEAYSGKEQERANLRAIEKIIDNIELERY